MAEAHFSDRDEVPRASRRGAGRTVVQVLAVCRKAGLVKRGHIAIDGTKMQANASKHKAMSYTRMTQAEKELDAVVRGWFEQAEEKDQIAGDAEHQIIVAHPLTNQQNVTRPRKPTAGPQHRTRAWARARARRSQTLTGSGS